MRRPTLAEPIRTASCLISSYSVDMFYLQAFAHSALMDITAALTPSRPECARQWDAYRPGCCCSPLPSLPWTWRGAAAGPAARARRWAAATGQLCSTRTTPHTPHPTPDARAHRHHNTPSLALTWNATIELCDEPIWVLELFIISISAERSTAGRKPNPKFVKQIARAPFAPIAFPKSYYWASIYNAASERLPSCDQIRCREWFRLITYK